MQESVIRLESQQINQRLSETNDRILAIQEQIRKLQIESLFLLSQKETLEKQLQGELKYDELQRQKNWDISERSINTVTEPELEYLPISILRQSFYYRNGSALEPAESLTRQELINKLRRTVCRYCRSIFHEINKCPVLAEKFCLRCLNKGHTIWHCPTYCCYCKINGHNRAICGRYRHHLELEDAERYANRQKYNRQHQYNNK